MGHDIKFKVEEKPWAGGSQTIIDKNRCSDWAMRETIFDFVRFIESWWVSSFSLFIQLYFVYNVQWSEDQFHIFVNVTRDKIMSPTVIVTMAVVR